MSAEREVEEIKIAYLEAYEAGQAPTLEEVIARHPQYQDTLIMFITTLIELEHAVERVPEPSESSASTRRLREQAALAACGAPTLREALTAAGVSREEVAAAANVPVSFIVRVERGRLSPDGDEPADPTFVARLGKILHQTGDEVLEILRATFSAPPTRGAAGHARGTGQPTAGGQQVPQSFRALLANCEDLTPAQRQEWLGSRPSTFDKN